MTSAPSRSTTGRSAAKYNDGTAWKLHYVSAREMYNIAKAAEAGETGEPGLYRDYVIARPGYREQARAAA